MEIDCITGVAGNPGSEADVRPIEVEAPGPVGATEPRGRTHDQEILVEGYHAPRQSRRAKLLVRVGDSSNEVRGVIDSGVAGDRPTRINSIEFLEACNEPPSVIPVVESDILMAQHYVFLIALGARLSEYRERVVSIGLCVVEPTKARKPPIEPCTVEGVAHLRVLSGSVEDSADVEKPAPKGAWTRRLACHNVNRNAHHPSTD
jgi:hypothetical protein